MAVAILDIDGTLVDTNYQHALAWYRAFRKHDVVLPIWRIHRHIGMGGDQLVPSLTDDGFEQQHGEAVRDDEKQLYMELIGEVEPMRDARKLKHVDTERARAVEGDVLDRAALTKAMASCASCKRRSR